MILDSSDIRLKTSTLWLTWQLTKQAATKSVTAMATLSSVSSSATSVTILLLLLTIIIAGVTINTQTASAVAWSKEFEDWLNRDGASYAVFCEGSLRLHQYISLVGDPQIIKLHNQVLGECDNNLLIIFKDVCPSHDNGFKVCGEPMVYQYLSERGLLSAKAPMEWKASTPEEQAAADALLRNFINRLH